MITAQNLTKKFPCSFRGKKGTPDSSEITAVSNASFHIAKGETVGLLGLNDSGKTTLLKLICGSLSPTSGFLRVSGQIPTARKSSPDNCIGFLSGQQIAAFSQKSPLSGGIFPDTASSLENNLKLLGTIYRIPAKIQRQRLQNLSETTNLEDFLQLTPPQLSLGQRMQEEISAMIFINPALFVLDEPFIGIDSYAQAKIRTQQQALANRGENTILITTHNLAEVERICGRILILDKGSLCYDGNLEWLKKSPTGHPVLQAVFKNDIPDLADLPVEKYSIDNRTLNIEYDPRIISAKELTCYLSSHNTILDLIIREPTLEEMIRRISVSKNQPSKRKD